ncbi:GFA family protein [Loktanella sp. S4079]|uniref:GFA family protein n=1 Tax=Loktanella sp. S4079 TaxID=579483 RepID=UPI0005F9AC22|nr:GFA family protein [Loktanella sp. S4079]KJZ20543.1 aldehyde-activating protein [Loktanella sp. S4079]
MPVQGSCLCGAITFSADQSPTTGNACHCTSCRKQSGHFFASIDIPKDALRITGTDQITWYHASEKARRGFCKTCGSTLFWDPLFQDWTAVAMGALDGETQLSLSMHIFTGEKGDYYELTDGITQNPT